MNDSRLLRKYRSERCLNCHHPLDVSDTYCPNCGQLNTTKKLSIGDIFNEFFASIISYDSKLRATLFALLFRPGKISKEYISGKRQRYVNPFRFYLSVSIIFFIIYGFTLNFDAWEGLINQDDEQANSQFNDIKNELDNVDVKVLDSIFSAAKAKKEIEIYQDSYVSEKQLDSVGLFKNVKLRVSLYGKFYDDTKITNSIKALDSLQHTKTRFHKYLYGKAVQLNNVGDNLGSVLAYFVGKLPFIIFFYLPILALFVWLLYVRRPFTYMEHLIFLFHIQSLFFVIFSIAVLLSVFGVGGTVFSITSLLFLIYLYIAMRKFYQQSHFKTILKFIALNVVFLILAMVGGIFALVLSFATF